MGLVSTELVLGWLRVCGAAAKYSVDVCRGHSVDACAVAPFFAAASIVIALNKDHLIARYEKLREEISRYSLFDTSSEVDRLDAELCHLEKVLPDWYSYPGDGELLEEEMGKGSLILAWFLANIKS